MDRMFSAIKSIEISLLITLQTRAGPTPREELNWNLSKISRNDASNKRVNSKHSSVLISCQTIGKPLRFIIDEVLEVCLNIERTSDQQ